MHPLLLSLALLSLPAGDASGPVVANLGIEVPGSVADHVSGDERFVVLATPDGAGPTTGPLAFAVFDVERLELHLLDVRAGRYPFVADGLLAYPEREGPDDLDGDGDLEDHVVRVVDLATRQSWSTGVALAYQYDFAPPSEPTEPHLVSGPGWVAFLADEQGQGADLDGDGVVGGNVLHVFTADDAVTRNHGVRGHGLVADEGVVALSVPETSTGGDRNGDGDTLDDVVHFVRPRDGALRNTGLAGKACGAGGGTIVVGVVEARQGATDLNGDGDVEDVVLHAYDTRRQVVRSTGTAGFAGAPGSCPVDGPRMAFLAAEAGHGDLDGDGDLQDLVWHALDAATGAVVNLGIPESPFAAANPGILAGELRGSLLLVGVSESLLSADLNGDGDLLDHVRFLYGFDTGQLTNTGAAIHRGALGEAYAIDRARESEWGGVDLNGDGDADDEVYLRLSYRSGAYTSLGLAGTRVPAPLASVAVVLVDEQQQGATDLDGDGTAEDERLVVLVDPLTGDWQVPGPTAAVLPVAETILRVGPAALFLAPEAEDGVDYDGDGVLAGAVAHLVLQGR